jgi:hypothetical protein
MYVSLYDGDVRRALYAIYAMMGSFGMCEGTFLVLVTCWCRRPARLSFLFLTTRRVGKAGWGCAVGRDARGKPCVIHVVISLIRARTRGVEELEYHTGAILRGRTPCCCARGSSSWANGGATKKV